jgi:hypothetical protein
MIDRSGVFFKHSPSRVAAQVLLCVAFRHLRSLPLEWRSVNQVLLI